MRHTQRSDQITETGTTLTSEVFAGMSKTQDHIM